VPTRPITTAVFCSQSAASVCGKSRSAANPNTYRAATANAAGFSDGAAFQTGEMNFATLARWPAGERSRSIAPLVTRRNPKTGSQRLRQARLSSRRVAASQKIVRWLKRSLLAIKRSVFPSRNGRLSFMKAGALRPSWQGANRPEPSAAHGCLTSCKLRRIRRQKWLRALAIERDH